jgi:hypothetical protein
MTKKLTVLGVAAVIENEGLGYAIQHYMSGDHIADPALAKMWDDAAKLLSQIQDYVAQEEVEVDGA